MPQRVTRGADQADCIEHTRLLPPAGHNSRRWLVAALIAVAFLALPDLRYPIGRDQATFLAIAHGLLKGKLLYKDLWDNKPPGIFYIYTVFVSLFGRSMWMMGVIDVLYLLGVSYFIFHFTERYLGPATGAAAAGLYVLLHERGGFACAAQPEVFIVLLVFLADYILVVKQRFPRLRNLAAGVLFGAAFWIKYNAGLFLLLGLLLPYLDSAALDAKPRAVRFIVPWKTWLERAACLAAGFAIVVIVQLSYFWLAGIWPWVKQAQFEVLPRYGVMILQHRKPYWLWALGTINFNLGSWVQAGAAAALAIAWWRREVGRVAPVFISATVGFAVAASQLRFNLYYFETCLPFLGMLLAYIPITLFYTVRTLSAHFRKRKMAFAGVLVWIAYANVLYIPFPVLAPPWLDWARASITWARNPQKSYARYRWPDGVEHLGGQMRVIRYLEASAGPRDRIFVWGTAPLIYYMTGKVPPNRFVCNLALMSTWGPPAWRQELVRDLKKSPPKFIIIARNDAVYGLTYTSLDSAEYVSKYRGLADILRRDYTRVWQTPNFAVYRGYIPGHLPTTANVPVSR